MAGRPSSYPNPVREWVVSQVCDQGRALKPIVEALNRGEVEDFPAYAVGYSTAQAWVKKEVQLRDRAVPLEDTTLDAFVTRLWAVAGGELRKLERDGRKSKPLDAKRLNELEAFAARCRRHLARDAATDSAQLSVASGENGPESLLDRLAREALRDEPSTAKPATTPTQPITGPSGEDGAAQAEPPRTTRDDASDVLSPAAHMQPQVA